jgi:heparan-alpha-glucosaminide N-acetyltransferase
MRPARLVSLDTYRGLTMMLLATGGLGLGHVAWRGCSVWDLIQPSFMFMVGVAIPYSYASRKSKGDSDGIILAHAVRRALILIALAVALGSISKRALDFEFVNVLAQIGLGYVPVFLLRGRRPAVQLGATAAILVGYWLLFALTPVVPGSGPFTGFAAHWNMNANPAHTFDLWFLNLFPRAAPFTGNEGGYQTLSFIPSMATMVLGLVAGETLRAPADERWKLRRLVVACAICFAISIACDPAIVPGLSGSFVVSPIVKRIWTPSWALFSSGWTFALLAALYWLVDLRRWTRGTFPFVVVGMNSIAIYLMSQLFRRPLQKLFPTVLGAQTFSGALWWVPAIGAALVMWLACYVMYRRRWFLRI